MNYDIAAPTSWPVLKRFFDSIYPAGHPARNESWWRWRFTGEGGRSFVALDKGGVAGHVGAAFGGGFVWIINVYLLPEYRGRGILRRLYAMAGQGPYPVSRT